MYSSVRQNICAILLVKDLILIDPDDETELSSVLAFRSVFSHMSAKVFMIALPFVTDKVHLARS